MSTINSNVTWTTSKEDTSKDVISQAPQQIFLLTVAYPQGGTSNDQIIKTINSFGQTISNQQHILLQPVGSVIPMTTVSKTKDSDEAIGNKDSSYSPLVVLNAPEIRSETCQESNVGNNSANFVIAGDASEPTNVHSQVLSTEPQPHIDEFELNEPSPVISFEESTLPEIPFSSKGNDGSSVNLQNGSLTITDDYLMKLKANQTENKERSPDWQTDSESDCDEVRHILSDKPVVPRARLTLPSTYLFLQSLPNKKDIIRVFAKKEIPIRAQFGPMEGVQIPAGRRDPPCPNLQLVIEKQNGSRSYLSVRNEELSNWMRYVRVAHKSHEQNLALSQIEGNLYFTTTKIIKAGQELRVWYSNRYAVKRNLPLLTKGSEKWRCPKCPFVSATNKPMNYHLTKHKNDKIEISDKDQEFLKFKLKPKKNSFDKGAWCDQCDIGFSTTARLELHLLTHSDDVDTHHSLTTSSPDDEPNEISKESVVCDVCGKVFGTHVALSLHYKFHYDDNVYECLLCKMTFDKLLEMKSHIPTHKNNGIFSCNVCSKEFPTYKQVRKHIRLGHSEHLFLCSICFKTFVSSDRLKNHMLSHSNDKQFLCANCGKQFKRKDKLVSHMKTVHRKDRTGQSIPNSGHTPKESPVNPDYIYSSFKCQDCQMGFKKRGCLVNHVLSRHPGRKLDSFPDLNQPIIKPTKDYHCQYCSKVYKSSTKRKAHILKNHPGANIPPSNQKLGVNTYTQTVGSVAAEPQSCQWCSKQYATKAKLIQHQRKAHLLLLPQSLRVPSYGSLSSKNGQNSKKSSLNSVDESKTGVKNNNQESTVIQNTVMELSENEGNFLSDGGIIVDGPTLKKALKLGESSSMECLLDSGLEQLLAESRPDQYFKILTQGGIAIAQPVEIWDPLNLAPPQTSNQTSNQTDRTNTTLEADVILPR